MIVATHFRGMHVVAVFTDETEEGAGKNLKVHNRVLVVRNAHLSVLKGYS